MKKEGSPPDMDTAINRRRTLLLLRRTMDALRGYFAELLRVKQEDKPNIYFQVFRNADLDDLNYWLEIIFSLGIATLGLIINSPAVVIGGMLISPLIGPILASGLAIAIGDFYLGFKSFTNILLSTVGSIVLAAVITWVLPFHSPTAEILARVQPTLLDLAIAVLSGLAGTIVICRGGAGGGVTALPGVAVAVALMPPLGVVGFGIGIGWDWNIIRGGSLLFLTNLVAIILSSVLVFFSIRMDAPAVREQITDWLEKQGPTERFYEAVRHTPLHRLLGKVGTFPRRLLILFLFLGLVCLPLARTLNRLVNEANTRRIVLNEIRNAIPGESLFREDVELAKDSVHVRIIAVLPEGFSPRQREQLEQVIQARTDRKADVFVYEVPTRMELTALTARAPAATLPALESLAELRDKMWMRIKPAIASVWPSDRAPLVGYDISFSPDSPRVRARLVYVADEDLGNLGQAMVQRNLRERTGSNTLELFFERIPRSWSFSFRPTAVSLSPASLRQLQELAAVLQRYPAVSCTLSVAEKRGKKKDILAQKRFENILKALAESKISDSRIQAKPGEGEANTALLTLVAPAL